eukprot:TRINITY_DN378_c0_g1_i7.p1 TRINITY_DN378_c0_g1~~TRINITY_DN378_c0_g1_i7.p1  ORF type:complete len:285 (-),score=72.07 TRINITY_DN378_c0_g1_i7:55-786(-)
MQDSMAVVHDYGGVAGCLLAGVFDGHGGDEIAQFASRNFPAFMARNLQRLRKKPNYIETSMRNSLNMLQEEVLKTDTQAGSTAIVAFMTPSGLLTVANIGDSRAVLSYQGTAVPLSVDHSPSNPVERGRVRTAGGYVAPDGRVNGELGLTRALGDTEYEGMVSSEPTFDKRQLNFGHQFLILACDGIWNVFSNEEAVSTVLNVLSRTNSPAEAATTLRDHAYLLDSRDNLSVIVVQFETDLKP